MLKMSLNVQFCYDLVSYSQLQMFKIACKIGYLIQNTQAKKGAKCVAIHENRFG